MPSFRIIQLGGNRSLTGRGRSRYIGYVERPDTLDMGDVTAVSGKAAYELEDISPSILLVPLVTRGEGDL